MGPTSILETLQDAFAEAYAIAARARANMRAVAESLESLREACNVTADLFALWNLFDEHLGRAGLGAFRPAMSALHAQFKQSVVSALIRDVAEAGKDDPVEGAFRWQETAARCFGDGNWRYELLTALADAKLSSVARFEEPFCRNPLLQQVVLCVVTGRWAETYDWFVHLTRQTRLPNDTRVRLLVIAAEIQFYHFRQPTRARLFLEEADRLVPEHPRTLVGWGGWHLESNGAQGLQEAEKCYRKIVSLRPRLADGYVNLGDVFERKEDFLAAECQYQEAILNAPGSADGYLRLWRLFGKPQWFKERSDRRSEMFRQLLLLEPDESNLHVDEGDTLRANGLWSESRAAYLRASQLNGRRLSARTGLAYSWMDEALHSSTSKERSAECLAAMEQTATQAIADFPEAPDAHWVRVWHGESTKNWREALDGSELIRRLHPEWASCAGRRMVTALRNLGQWDRAETELRQSLALEPNQPAVYSEFNELGDAAKAAGDRLMAARFFAEARRLRGEDGEYDYQNRLGHLDYNERKYLAAAGHYRLAIDARPSDPVLHSNLAFALVEAKTPGKQLDELREAAKALGEASRLAPANAEYRDRLSNLRRMQDLVDRYGEAALTANFVGTPIRVDLLPELLSQVLKEGVRELSEATLSRIQELRERVLRDTGVGLPGLLISEQVGSGPGPDAVVISLYDEAGIPCDFSAHVSSAATKADAMMTRIEEELRKHLSRFVTHDFVAMQLGECKDADCAEIRASPLRLTAFVMFLQERVNAGENLVAFASLAERFVRQFPVGGRPRDPAPWTWENPPPVTPTTVLLGPGYDLAEVQALADDLEAGRIALMERSGVLAPRIDCHVEPGFPPRAFQLRMGGHAAPMEEGLAKDEVWLSGSAENLPAEWKPRARTECTGTPGVVVRADVKEVQQRFPGRTVGLSLAFAGFQLGFRLGRHIDLSIDLVNVEHRLALLASTHPALVASVRARFSSEDLVYLLRVTLVVTGNLRNSPNVLEQLLTQPAELVDRVLGAVTAQSYDAVIERMREQVRPAKV